MILELICCCGHMEWFVLSLVCENTTVVGTDNLTQASVSRLGEVSIGSPRPSRAKSRLGDSLSFEQASVSPKRECAEGHCSRFSSSRLGEGAGLSESLSCLGEALQPERGAGREFVSDWCSSCSWVFDLYLIVLLYDGMGEMSMHEWEAV